MGGASRSMRDAKNGFGALARAARRKPQTVTKHGKPAVVVLDAMAYARLGRLDVPPFTEHLLAMPSDDGTYARLSGRFKVPEA